MAIFTKHDEKGYYIDVIDDDRDYVTPMKIGDSYVYRIRGPVADHINHLETNNKELKGYSNTLLEQRDYAIRERDELLYSIYHTKAAKRFLSNNKII